MGVTSFDSITAKSGYGMEFFIAAPNHFGCFYEDEIGLHILGFADLYDKLIAIEKDGDKNLIIREMRNGEETIFRLNEYDIDLVRCLRHEDVIGCFFGRTVAGYTQCKGLFPYVDDTFPPQNIGKSTFRPFYRFALCYGPTHLECENYGLFTKEADRVVPFGFGRIYGEPAYMDFKYMTGISLSTPEYDDLFDDKTLSKRAIQRALEDAGFIGRLFVWNDDSFNYELTNVWLEAFTPPEVLEQCYT